MKSDSTNLDRYIKESTLNISSRKLLSKVKESFVLDEQLRSLSLLDDEYKDPFICIEWKNVRELISEQCFYNKKLFDRLSFLLTKSEEKPEQSKTYTESYSLTVKFKDPLENIVFASQVECIKLSATKDKMPYRVSEIKTLPAEKEGVGGASYKNIKYQCWEYIDNSVIKKILKGKLDQQLDYDQKISCSQIIAMIVCESSRNPTSYITAPMTLELINYWLNNGSTLMPKIKALFDAEGSDKIPTEAKSQEKSDIEQTKEQSEHPIEYVFYKIFNLKTELQDVENVENKSKITSIFINNLFPMVMQGAVSVSRHITKLLNAEQMEAHHHDLGTPSTGKKLTEFINREKTLVTLWKECFPDASINTLTKDWFDVDLGQDYSFVLGDSFAMDDIP